MNKPGDLHFQKILVFNTTLRDVTGVALIVDGKIKKKSVPARAQDLQKITSEFLESAKVKISEIDAIAVLTGPGSYTGTRMGVAAANTLSWWLNKPIIELDGSSLEEALKTLQTRPPAPVSEATARY